MNTIRFGLACLFVTLVACGSDDNSSSSSSSGSSGQTSSGSSTSESCSTAKICVNNACKCMDGPNKDKPCVDEGTGADGCPQLCKVCKTN